MYKIVWKCRECDGYLIEHLWGRREKAVCPFCNADDFPWYKYVISQKAFSEFKKNLDKDD